MINQASGISFYSIVYLHTGNRWRWKPTVTTVISKLYYWDTVDLIRDADHIKEVKDGIGNPLMDTYSDVKIAKIFLIEQGTALDKCQNEYCYVLTNDPCRTSILKHRVIKKVTYQCIKKTLHKSTIFTR